MIVRMLRRRQASVTKRIFPERLERHFCWHLQTDRNLAVPTSNSSRSQVMQNIFGSKAGLIVPAIAALVALSATQAWADEAPPVPAKVVNHQNHEAHQAHQAGMKHGARQMHEIGRASCRERVCQYV